MGHHFNLLKPAPFTGLRKLHAQILHENRELIAALQDWRKDMGLTSFTPPIRRESRRFTFTPLR